MVFIECKKCPYFENRRDIAAGRVLVGFCKLRGKHMSDTTRNKEFCKDRATVDVPANAKTVAINPEPSLFTDKEKEQLSRAAQKPVERSPSSPTLAELSAKQQRPEPSAAPSPRIYTSAKEVPPSDYSYNQKGRASVKPALPEPRAEIDRSSRQPEKKKPVQPENVQIVPPLKMTPQEAMKLLEQQQAGRINAKFTKYGNEAKVGEKEVIRKAVWGGRD